MFIELYITNFNFLTVFSVTFNVNSSSMNEFRTEKKELKRPETGLRNIRDHEL